MRPENRYGNTAHFMTLGTDEVVVDEGEKVNKDILQALGRKLKHFYEAQDHVSDPKASGDSHNDYREAFAKDQVKAIWLL